MFYVCKEGHAPTKWSEEALGYDLFVSEYTEIPPGQVLMVPLGVKTNWGSFMYARSSLWKLWLMLANWVWVIDPDYRWEIKAAMYNYTDWLICLGIGMKVCQLVPIGWKLEPFVTDDNQSISMEAAYESWWRLNVTERWEGGFWSTGTC